MPSQSPTAEDPSRTLSHPRSRTHSKMSTSHHDHSRSRSRTRSYSPSRSRSRSRTRSQSRPRSSKIVVEKLTKNVHARHLDEIFGSYGEIQDLDLPLNHALMTNKGIAYILYTQPSYAEAAIAHMHEAQLDGAVIAVSTVLPRRNRSPSLRRPSSGRYGDVYREGPVRGGEDSYRAPATGHWPGKRSPPRRGGRGGAGRGRYGDRRVEDRNSYRPGRGYSDSPSRSRSPPPPAAGRRSPSYLSRSQSRGRASPSSARYRRRSPSYSSYASRSRSPNRDRGGGRGGR